MNTIGSYLDSDSKGIESVSAYLYDLANSNAETKITPSDSGSPYLYDLSNSNAETKITASDGAVYDYLRRSTDDSYCFFFYNKILFFKKGDVSWN